MGFKSQEPTPPRQNLNRWGLVLARRKTLVAQTFVIMKKEWVDIKSSLFSFHNLQAGILPILFFCVAFGVYEPLRKGTDWMQSPIMVFSLSVLVPFIVIGFISPYAFVGERKRGTLEPLLATPVSDQAILFGKIGIAVLYGWGISFVSMFLGLFSLFFSTGKFLFYPLSTAIPTLLLSLFFSLLVAIIGTNASLYARTLLEAQNNLGMALFIPVVLPAFFVGPFMPEAWRTISVQVVARLGITEPLLVFMVVLFIVDTVSMLVTRYRFHRKLLIFE
jgi:ABC-2 type transport system permease protein